MIASAVLRNEKTIITYDAIGNPLSYKGFNMGWSGGRQLTTISGNGVTSGSFKYDSNGQRTEKKISGVTTDYYYVGGQLLAENRGGTTYYYQYDAAGRPAKIFYVSSSGTATAYYLVSNSRGDIEEIWSGSGNLTARYFYDAFGNVTSIKNAAGAEITSATNIAKINPFRYRGYYYDSETGLYYLGSRYYDPQTGRFINADGMVDTAQDMHGANMFSYCGNDPVNKSDPDGTHWYFLWLDNLFKFGAHKPAQKKRSTISLAGLFNAAVNAAINITAAKTGNPAAAKAVGSVVKMGDGYASPNLQKTIDAASKHNYVTDLTVGASTPIPAVSVQAGYSKIISPQMGANNTYIHAGANLGYSPVPASLTYSIGIVSNYYLPSDYNGFAYSLNANAFYGGAYSGWFTNDVKTHLFSLSTSPGGSAGIDHYWDVSNK